MTPHEVTPAMVDAAIEMLKTSGILDEFLLADRSLFEKIYRAMQDEYVASYAENDEMQ